MDDTFQIPNQSKTEKPAQSSVNWTEAASAMANNPNAWTEADASVMNMTDGLHDFGRWTENLSAEGGTAPSGQAAKMPTNFAQEFRESQSKNEIMQEGEQRFNYMEKSGHYTENFELRTHYNDIQAIEQNLDEWRNSATSSGAL